MTEVKKTNYREIQCISIWITECNNSFLSLSRHCPDVKYLLDREQAETYFFWHTSCSTSVPLMFHWGQCLILNSYLSFEGKRTVARPGNLFRKRHQHFTRTKRLTGLTKPNKTSLPFNENSHCSVLSAYSKEEGKTSNQSCLDADVGSQSQQQHFQRHHRVILMLWH